MFQSDPTPIHAATTNGNAQVGAVFLLKPLSYLKTPVVFGGLPKDLSNDRKIVLRCGFSKNTGWWLLANVVLQQQNVCILQLHIQVERVLFTSQEAQGGLPVLHLTFNYLLWEWRSRWCKGQYCTPATICLATDTGGGDHGVYLRLLCVTALS